MEQYKKFTDALATYNRNCYVHATCAYIGHTLFHHLRAEMELQLGYKTSMYGPPAEFHGLKIYIIQNDPYHLGFA